MKQIGTLRTSSGTPCHARERPPLSTTTNLPMKLSFDLIVVFVGVSILCLLPGVVIVGYAYMESRAFNRLTGAHTTWMDAAFVELRVQEAPR